MSTSPATQIEVLEPERSGDVVDISLPADPGYLALIRTATAGLAARVDFTLDEIEDLRIAVDEACALLLDAAVPGASLRCTFELHDDTLVIDVTVASSSGGPDQDSFAWTVLSALTGSVTTRSAGGLVTISLRKQRGPRG